MHCSQMKKILILFSILFHINSKSTDNQSSPRVADTGALSWNFPERVIEQIVDSLVDRVDD